MATNSSYLDYAAGAPPWPEALATYAEVSRDYPANPSSSHPAGQAAAAALAGARAELASECGHTGELILTSGGTEANNLVIRGIMDKHPKGRLLIGGDVHPSVWFATETYRKRVDIVPTESDGSLSADRLTSLITKRTVLCSVVHANNEIGKVHDIAALSKACHENKTLIHCDGAQVPGHIPLNLDQSVPDFYTIAAHKFGGPRGVGGVFMRDASPLPQLEGGGQEKGLRSGTENVAGLAATVRALQCSNEIMTQETERLRQMAQELVARITASDSTVLLNSDLENGLPGLVSLSLPGTQGNQLAAELGMHGFAISTGSACHAGALKASRTIQALGRSQSEALGTIRISLGRNTSPDEVAAFTDALLEIVDRQKALA